VTVIHMTVPDAVWWHLAAVADRKGQKVDELLAEVVTGIAAPDPVVHMHSQGLTDAQIAQRTGLLLGTIATRRRKAGLKPNRKTKENRS
jgi:hypothetical protein